MIFILFTLFSAVMVRFVLETLSNRSYHPPFTVVMGLVGVLCGAVNKQLDDDGLWQKSVTYWSEVRRLADSRGLVEKCYSSGVFSLRLREIWNDPPPPPLPTHLISPALATITRLFTVVCS